MKKYIYTALSGAFLTASILAANTSETKIYPVKESENLLKLSQNMPIGNLNVSDTIKNASATKIYKTTANVNLRSGASTSSKILLTVPKSKTITYLGKSGSWYKVSYGGKTGYMSSSYLSLVSQSVSSSSASTTYTYKTTSALNLRSGAGTGYGVLKVIPNNAAVTYLGKSGSWYKVSYDGKSGWVSSAYIKSTVVSTTANSKPVSSSTTYTYKTTSALNLRSGAGTGYGVLKVIPNNAAVTYLGKSGSWYKVSYDGKSGWVSSAYIKATAVSNSTPAKPVETKPVSNSTTYTYKTTSALNLRSGAGTGYGVLKVIPNNAAVTYLGNSGSWYKVSYGGKTGWVSSAYIKKTAVSNSTSTKPAETKPAETKPAETKPAETKPAETKPVETKPAEIQKYITTDDLNLRKGAGTSFVTIATMPSNSVVEFTGVQSNGWYQVKYNGLVGYASSTYLQKYVPGTTIVEVNSNTFYTGVSATLYSGAGTGTSKLETISPKQKLDLVSKSGSWYKVKHGNKTGYIQTSNIISSENMNRILNYEKNKNSYLFMDLRTKSSVTAAQINNYISSSLSKSGKKNSVLNGKGQAFIDAGNKYGVNALYLAAHAIHESGYGASVISLERYNMFGYGAYDLVPYLGAVKFATIEENINFIAHMMKASYLGNEWRNQGEYLGYSVKSVSGTRIDSLSKGMNFYYASDEKWGEKIASHMEKILTYNKEGATKLNPNKTAFSAPKYPNGVDTFSANTLATAKSSITLYNSKNGSSVGTIKSGSDFYLLEKDNNYWLKVKYNGKVYYVNPSFSKFNSYFTVHNLGRVTTSANENRTIAFKTSASSSSSTISNIPSGKFVELKLSGKKPVTSNGYYQVAYNGKTGWINTGSIIQDLK